ncbi:hypothetical protein Ae201684P_003277 [Aphanomyces euteiches]|uniref:Amino acid transporter n=1 Tax=Aphanomyces euteiches TaxID=100861 RepID=A0A6G0X3A1_9STRA|nr:hypothetical protein Ae201684_009122 [Aphanomyces euteiches]KAH9073774.1 hypothetical protein Ae201684P_003277 [Aphanomyces euteiches]
MVHFHPQEDQPVELKAPKSLTRKILTSLTFWLIVGTALGILLGSEAPNFSEKAAPTANLFLRPIQFTVFPLVFSSLVHGIAGQSDLKSLGRVALKAFIYFEVVTTFALLLGLLAVNVAKPGVSDFGKTVNTTTTKATALSYATWINHLAPKTWGEMMGGSGTSELLQVLVAAVLFGTSTAFANKEAKTKILEISEAVMLVMFKFVDIVIWTAPIGVCFSVASAIASNGGLHVLASLGKLIATYYVTAAIFMLVVFGPILWYLKLSPLEFLQGMREPLLIAYTTATTEAALPKVIESLDAFGVSEHITAFIVPFGYSFNLDGAALYLTMGSMFCAQAAGVHKTLGEQMVMFLLLIVSSKGVAGVRASSIVVIAATLDQFDIPAWTVGLILGGDWFIDMGRAFVSVFGNCLATILMAKLEGEFRKEGWNAHHHVDEMSITSPKDVLEDETSPCGSPCISWRVFRSSCSLCSTLLTESNAVTPFNNHKIIGVVVGNFLHCLMNVADFGADEACGFGQRWTTIVTNLSMGCGLEASGCLRKRKNF